MNKGCLFSTIHIAQLGVYHDIFLDAENELDIFGPDPMRFRIGLLLSIVFSIRDKKRFCSQLSLLGWNMIDDSYSKERFSHQFAWNNHQYVRSILQEQRAFSISLGIRLNGRLLGWIRERAIRNPEWIHSLLNDPTCRFRFSMLVDNLFSTASCHFSNIMLGSAAIPISEQPDWLLSFLDHLSGLFCLVHRLPVSQLAREALLSIDKYDNYLGFCSALHRYGCIRVVDEEDGEPFLLCDEAPIAMYGNRIQNATQQAAGLHLTGASIFWVEDEFLCDIPEGVQVWTSSPNGMKLGQQKESTALSWKSLDS